MNTRIRSFKTVVVGLSIMTFLASETVYTSAAEFRSDWHNQHDRVWLGPAQWANPMENWRIEDGRLEVTSSAQNHSVHLLTHQLSERDGEFELSVVVGVQGGNNGESKLPGAAGFEIGIRSELGDYRSSLIRGTGIRLAITTDARILVGATGRDPASTVLQNPRQVLERLRTDGLRLVWRGKPAGNGYRLTCRVEDPETGELLRAADPTDAKTEVDGLGSDGDVVTDVDSPKLRGNVAVISNPAWKNQRRQPPRQRRRRSAKFWFRDLRVSGKKIRQQNQQAFGPILYAMHTLSRGVMKMTAQMPPIGPEDTQSVLLQVPRIAAEGTLAVPDASQLAEPGDWVTLARANIDSLSRTAHFRIPNWPETRDVRYRLLYIARTRNGERQPHDYTGIVRQDPIHKPTISVAGFTGHKDTAFPNELLVSNVLKHNPDVCLFTGDQIYEDAGGFGIIRRPAGRAVLNYLRKIYLWGWSFRDLLRDRPSFVLPDDHDVYQGNIWGQGGRPAPGGLPGHAAGGFVEPPDFVNAVFRTQVGHHPDPYDPTPMLQGIDCWYGDCVYGRISFAIIADRYFKSGPQDKVNKWPGRPDHVKNKDYDTSLLDKKGLILLGQRQLDFLQEWAQDWRGADMKCVCSQTIFCNLANYHGGNQEFVFADLDSNGWPQTPRNRAVDAMRRGFAFHYAGDQHLPSIVHHGIDTWRDANWSFCVPSTAAGYPRSWRPDEEGRPVQKRPAPGLANTGDYRDAFGNPITVYAVGNPANNNRSPVLELLHDKSSGYGLVHFSKLDRTIKIECWRLIFDADHPKPNDQFPGWPKTISMQDNYGRQAIGVLPRIDVVGHENSVLQVINEEKNEVEYTLRIRGSSFSPKVFGSGTYTVRVGDQETNRMRMLRGLQPTLSDGPAVRVKIE